MQRIPPEQLLNQLDMFSSRLDIDEAMGNAAGLPLYFLPRILPMAFQNLMKKLV